MLNHINKPMFVMGGGINYLLDNNDYNKLDKNYKDKFRIGLSLCSFYFISLLQICCKIINYLL